MAKVEVVVNVCDNPECRRVERVDELGYCEGIHISVGDWHLNAGGPLAETYACSWSCLGKAAEARVDEEWHR